MSTAQPHAREGGEVVGGSLEEDKVEKKIKIKEIGERLTGGVHWW
jgi:hypothetical protein